MFLRTLFFFLVFSATSALAAVRGHFFGITGMIQVLPHNIEGITDNDSVLLYQAMNVPEQQSMLGPGKAFYSPDRALDFVCGIRNSSIYECTLMLKNSPFVRLDPLHRLMSFHVEGAEADQLRQNFFLTAERFDFRSADGKLQIVAFPGSFRLTFQD